MKGHKQQELEGWLRGNMWQENNNIKTIIITTTTNNNNNYKPRNRPQQQQQQQQQLDIPKSHLNQCFVNKMTTTTTT